MVSTVWGACFSLSSEYPGAIRLAFETGPFHTSPKRKRGNRLARSLALRAGINFNRERHKSVRAEKEISA